MELCQVFGGQITETWARELRMADDDTLSTTTDIGSNLVLDRNTSYRVRRFLLARYLPTCR